ncbi:uncharacterized protein CANTADRAFT_113116 [Suhomyces tanzawaensis NRRL Y-17324]|uniref:Uncharacterized protein n=1 Tax=Suhomyces tanzawaensis NRRL Y-17324 TaxID=984487 RepID=A0A1E4SQ22_9ASCO|nr:uncharacterized protein CANTADRAFT_113116 [Suhomyces tanzawaensis NRRL Y-17324]ODV81610.1 hypothetical protein CANTADRAFT_113116 [Suhomyces tanzawaensis NRRL Y-17324]
MMYGCWCSSAEHKISLKSSQRWCCMLHQQLSLSNGQCWSHKAVARLTPAMPTCLWSYERVTRLTPALPTCLRNSRCSIHIDSCLALQRAGEGEAARPILQHARDSMRGCKSEGSSPETAWCAVPLVASHVLPNHVRPLSCISRQGPVPTSDTGQLPLAPSPWHPADAARSLF